MAFFRRAEPDRPKALTAATAPIDLGDSSSWQQFKRGGRQWQGEAWRLYDIVPELRFLSGWIGDSISQARLYVTRIDSSGEEDGEVTDRRILEIGDEPLGEGAERDDNLRLCGVDLAVAGEFYLVGEDANTPQGGPWYVLTHRQIKNDGGKIFVDRPRRLGGGARELSAENDVLIRTWESHPDAINEPDSPARAALPILREIELITKREFAELDSRLTGAGVWILPDGIDFPEQPGDPPGMSGTERFGRSLQLSAARSIKNPQDASALVPLIATVAPELIDLIKDPYTFHTPVSDNLLPMKESAIRRLATSYKTPPEILTGMGDTNHWSAWAISEDGIKRIKPFLSLIADSLTRGFLQPALQRAGIADFDSYAYAFDVAPLAVRPNRLAESSELYNLGLLTGETVVKSGAFDTDNMPTEEERIREAILRALPGDPLLLSNSAVQEILGLSLTPEPAPSPPPLPATQPVGEQDGPPEPNGPTESQLTVANLMVLRALELAGGRLTTPGDRRGRWAAYGRHELHSRVGPIVPDRADRALEGAWTHVAIAAKSLGVDELEARTVLHEYCASLLIAGKPHSLLLLRRHLEDVVR